MHSKSGRRTRLTYRKRDLRDQERVDAKKECSISLPCGLELKWLRSLTARQVQAKHYTTLDVFARAL